MTLLTRRSLLAVTATAATLAATRSHADTAQAPADPRLAERGLGSTTAKARVEEWFSLTCTHCAAFAAEVFPKIRTGLIDTGKLRYVFKDFPLDQVALTAAMVARALPPERYEPFIMMLFQTQDRWAFARDVNSTEELAKMASLAGMPRTVFDKTVNDTAFRDAILAEQTRAAQAYNVDSTPSFVCNGKIHKGEMTYESFTSFAGLG
jgi:protein-disulfide isomerase